ncbi:B-cell receptor CD22-like [Siniperca chuatsi]|uniref:B-cell receptor CD22-like n=1 Tax=Siniperca chuatsi TaxID=119488 RepID=UPI001CE0EFE9|nr:B-cell receptor CD22-like [Siniperca chuatsi]
MAAALTLLLIGCLLQSALCGEFTVTVPKTIEVLKGSCVTIPCSFDIENKYESNLDNTCKAAWKISDPISMFDSSNPQLSTIKGNFTGDLKKKDCTTTLNNIQPSHSNKYFFRVECNNQLKYSFHQQTLYISVKDDPPRPTLTPSTLERKEGTSVSLTCSAPAPCLSHPPTLTFSPSLGDSQETLQENQDKTKVKTSVLTFTASHLHHRQEISCSAVYNKLDGSNESSVSTRLTADISYSPKHTTVLVSPSGPVPEDSTLTLTCSTSANPPVKNYTWYRADGGQETFIGTGRVLNITASKVSGPFFCKAENGLGAGRSNISQIDVQFAPHILYSDCTTAAGQLNCSCETVGNPSPTLQWYLNELPVNHSDRFAVSNEPLNDTGLRSIITVNQPLERDLSTLRCCSSNSLGSAFQQFYVYVLEPQTSAESHVMLTVFIATVVMLLVLVCALLLVIRAQKTHHNLPKSTVAINQLLTSGEGNEVPKATEEDIYVNADVLRKADVAHPATISEPNSTNLPSSGPNNAEGASKSSEKKNEESSDVIYSSVNWKSKKKKQEDSVDMDQPCSSYLEEDRCVDGGMCRNFGSNTLEMGSLYDEVEPKNVKEYVECEYAQVKFENKSAMHN